MSPKHRLHRLMLRYFGSVANETSHRWLRSITGKCHVSDCNDQEVREAVRILSARVRLYPRVRDSVWRKLENA